ncbi:hypothetical protein D3C75_998460 [compost metagenome]
MDGVLHTQLPAVLQECRDITLGNLRHRAALQLGPLDHFVVHIGEVHHIGYLVADGLQITADHVEHNHRSAVANMNIVIYCRSANIHPHLAFLNGAEFLLGPAQRIIDS